MDRRIPEFAPRLYQVAEINAGKAIEHSYKSHVSHDRQRNDIGSNRPRVSLLTRVLDTSLRDIPRKSVDYLLKRHPQRKGSKGEYSEGLLSQSYELEPQSVLQGPGNKPQIVYYYTSLNSMNKIPDESVDAVVSVSALEHNLPEEVAVCLEEFRRVLKPGAWMHLTVSASYPHSAFHEPSHSWLLNEEDAQRTYSLRPGYHTNFSEFPKILAELKKPKYLEKWLSLQYFRSGTNGMPWGMWDPQYVPVGISLKTSSRDNYKG
ncbi:MAG: class I SAM-dependent methyltransferase [Desulfomonile tiedjei]|nr:class I SAM-dependent methyltransferase [Desulfomonile tiedjei]